MRLAGFLACALVAWDCADKALGVTTQRLFSADYLWAWWISAAVWALYAIAFVVRPTA